MSTSSGFRICFISLPWSELLLRHGNESPVPLPGRIVDLPDPLHLGVEILHVDGTNGDAVADASALSATRSIFFMSMRWRCCSQAYRSLDTFRSPTFHQSRIVLRIVGHHDHRVGIEAFHQHAAFVVGGRIHRAAQKLGAAVEHPLARALEQGIGDRRVVDALEEPEKAGVLLMKTIMRLIEDGRHPAHHLAIFFGQEKLGFGVGVERVFGGPAVP
jgi:hypothetical protein